MENVTMTTTTKTTIEGSSVRTTTTTTDPILEIRLEIYLFTFGTTLFWLICMGLLWRHNRILKKMRKHDDISLVIKEEKGGAQYMVSFFTGDKYSRPPSGVVRIHLIGSLYPGKFHDLVDPSKSSSLFAPLSREKFIVTEDVPLGRIIAIVLQTEDVGDNPSWQCQTIIVRDVTTNEAWYFRVRDEVGFPPLTIQAATQEELTSFSRSFHRRIRREVRQGQYIYFGFWFRTNRSVYSFRQRAVVAFVCHLFLISFSLVFLGLAFPPEQTDTVKTHVDRPFTYEVKGVEIIPGQHGRTNWLNHALVIGSMVSFLTSCVGYIMVALFRQRRKYERHFEEMDYVIATALHEHSIKKLKQADVHPFSPPPVEAKRVESIAPLSVKVENTNHPRKEVKKVSSGDSVKFFEARQNFSSSPPLLPSPGKRWNFADELPVECCILPEEVNSQPQTPTNSTTPLTSTSITMDEASSSLAKTPTETSNSEITTGSPTSASPVEHEPSTWDAISDKVKNFFTFEKKSKDESKTQIPPNQSEVPGVQVPPIPTVEEQQQPIWRRPIEKIMQKFSFGIRNSEKEHRPQPLLPPAGSTTQRRGGSSFQDTNSHYETESGSSVSVEGSPRGNTITTEMLEDLAEKFKKQPKTFYTETPSSSSKISSPIIYQPSIKFNEIKVTTSGFQQYHLLGDTPFEKRVYMRKLFVANNFSYSPGVALNRIRSFDEDEIELGSAREMSVDGQTWFGAPVPPKRKWYRPIKAWLFVIFVTMVSLLGIIFTVSFGKVQLHGDSEFFFLILSATIMISLLMGAFLIETVKICLIGMIYAILDRGLYKRTTRHITRKIKKNASLEVYGL